MRHLKNRNKLGVKTSHRMAMVRNLVTQLLQHKQIVTTLARAKNIRTPVDRMIVLAKKNNFSNHCKNSTWKIYKNRQSGL